MLKERISSKKNQEISAIHLYITYQRWNADVHGPSRKSLSGNEMAIFVPSRWGVNQPASVLYNWDKIQWG